MAFRRALHDAGADTLLVPTLAIQDPADGGDALRQALATGGFDWIVVTSANGARRLHAALEATGTAAPRIATVGPRTADVIGELGMEVELVPDEFVAEGLVDAFPPGAASVLVVRPEVARTVVARGLAAKGHAVTEVVAYRTGPAPISEEAAAEARAADVVTFTSPLAYEAYVAAVGLPEGQVVASIGPVTTAAIAESGVDVTLEADPHTTDGIVDALVATREMT